MEGPLRGNAGSGPFNRASLSGVLGVEPVGAVADSFMAGAVRGAEPPDRSKWSMSSFAVRLLTGVTGGSPADRGEERCTKSPLFRAFGRVGDGSGGTGPGSCNVVPMGFVGWARDVDGTS